MVKSNGKIQSLPDYYDEADESYDEELDNKVQKCYDDIVNEIQQLQRTKMWSSARLAELYFFGDEKMTLDKLSKNIGISKSTSFLNVKKIKQHIRLTKVNPFKN
jgi:DNA-binding transcriptional regulator GbsR (MarR family)